MDVLRFRGSYEVVVTRCVALCRLGTLAIHEGAFAHGTRLLGAALPRARAFLRVSCPDVHLDCEAALTSARAALGEAAVAAAWDQGQVMSLDRAVAAALEDSDDAE